MDGLLLDLPRREDYWTGIGSKRSIEHRESKEMLEVRGAALRASRLKVRGQKIANFRFGISHFEFENYILPTSY